MSSTHNRGRGGPVPCPLPPPGAPNPVPGLTTPTPPPPPPTAAPHWYTHRAVGLQTLPQTPQVASRRQVRGLHCRLGLLDCLGHRPRHGYGLVVRLKLLASAHKGTQGRTQGSWRHGTSARAHKGTHKGLDATPPMLRPPPPVAPVCMYLEGQHAVNAGHAQPNPQVPARCPPSEPQRDAGVIQPANVVVKCCLVS